MAKRTSSITVKLSPADYSMLTKAAAVIWPGAIMTNSSIVLSLAKIAAENILGKRKKK
ncbi:MAG: hypothetical protein LAO20_21420 [Acidobacteriia bacterium]|nr:hypothetical protein [Terriglobia bacterium]